jgi:hypothetical protein
VGLRLPSLVRTLWFGQGCPTMRVMERPGYLPGVCLRSFVASALVAVAAAMLLPNGALAAPIRECGNHGYANGRIRWTYGPLDAGGIFNVTSRVVDCPTARRVVLGASRKTHGHRFTYRLWSCRVLSQGTDHADLRCTRAAGRVVRWQVGA